MTKQLHKVRHDIIRYANCWEDADILIDGLQVGEGDRVLSIGSAGDNSFSMLLNNPEIVVAVDINPVQLKLIELKKAAFRYLSYDEFIEFLGFKAGNSGQRLFDQLKPGLEDEVRIFWEANFVHIQKGIIHCGKFENYFRIFRTLLLPLIHSKATIDALFEEKDANAQVQFFREKWDNNRWRMLFRIFFSKQIMGKFGRDPAFLREVDIPVATFILNQTRNHLSSTHCFHNYFLHYILTGQFGNRLPHYARKENFDAIKSVISRLKVFHGLAEDAFLSFNNFNKFNLSNIFEYMEPDLFRKVVENMVANSDSGARFAYWNLMVPRKMTAINNQLKQDDDSMKRLAPEDNGFFYSDFIVDLKK